MTSHSVPLCTYLRHHFIAQSTVMKAFGAGETFQCELRMQKSSANFTILGADGSIKSGAALDVKIGVVTLMVGFGPVEAGKPPFEVILKGQVGRYAHGPVRCCKRALP